MKRLRAAEAVSVEGACEVGGTEVGGADTGALAAAEPESRFANRWLLYCGGGGGGALAASGAEVGVAWAAAVPLRKGSSPEKEAPS